MEICVRNKFKNILTKETKLTQIQWSRWAVSTVPIFNVRHQNSFPLQSEVLAASFSVIPLAQESITEPTQLMTASNTAANFKDKKHTTNLFTSLKACSCLYSPLCICIVIETGWALITTSSCSLLFFVFWWPKSERQLMQKIKNLVHLGLKTLHISFHVVHYSFILTASDGLLHTTILKALLETVWKRAGT